MASIQPDTHSFVVKVWLERAAGDRSPPAWRGRITHVPSGQTHSFTDLGEIGVFVGPYLEQGGAQPAQTGRPRHWWERLWRVR